MKEYELETSRTTLSVDIERINELTKWFRFEYPSRLATINRYLYLGIKPPESRYSLELEAYEKENELRMLNGQEPLPEIKYKDLF
jgi:hypothetical protein